MKGLIKHLAEGQQRLKDCEARSRRGFLCEESIPEAVEVFQIRWEDLSYGLKSKRVELAAQTVAWTSTTSTSKTKTSVLRNFPPSFGIGQMHHRPQSRKRGEEAQSLAP